MIGGKEDMNNEIERLDNFKVDLMHILPEFEELQKLKFERESLEEVVVNLRSLIPKLKGNVATYVELKKQLKGTRGEEKETIEEKVEDKYHEFWDAIQHWRNTCWLEPSVLDTNEKMMEELENVENYFRELKQMNKSYEDLNEKFSEHCRDGRIAYLKKQKDGSKMSDEIAILKDDFYRKIISWAESVNDSDLDEYLLEPSLRKNLLKNLGRKD